MRRRRGRNLRLDRLLAPGGLQANARPDSGVRARTEVNSQTGAGGAWQLRGAVRAKPTSAEPRKLLSSAAGAADGVKKKFFQCHFFAGLQRRPCNDSGPQLVERSLGHQVAAIDDPNVSAEPLDNLQHMRHKKDCRAMSDH